MSSKFLFFSVLWEEVNGSTFLLSVLKSEKVKYVTGINIVVSHCWIIFNLVPIYRTKPNHAWMPACLPSFFIFWDSCHFLHIDRMNTWQNNLWEENFISAHRFREMTAHHSRESMALSVWGRDLSSWLSLRKVESSVGLPSKVHPWWCTSASQVYLLEAS